MTDLKTRLAAIRARCEKATQKPWDWEREEDGCIVWSDGREDGGVIDSDVASIVHYPEDATFIAHARADVPMLLPMGELVAKCAEAPCAMAPDHDCSKHADDGEECWPCRARALLRRLDEKGGE